LNDEIEFGEEVAGVQGTEDDDQEVEGRASSEAGGGDANATDHPEGAGYAVKGFRALNLRSERLFHG
jgi:hypothetical protein